MGMVEGYIMATIIASHITMNIAAAANSPPKGIHILFMVHSGRLLAHTLS
jgi:hypothetical protein